MKPGQEYEIFVHEAFSSFYPDAVVTFDDHILGQESGIDRQIDVSVKMEVEGEKLLYVVQAKDWVKPADIITIGQFSSVIQDIGASKGILICAAGFAKTINTYARNKGIDLITIEDIKSKKWKAVVEIPLVHTIQRFNHEGRFGVETTEALVKVLQPGDEHQFHNFPISVDDGKTFTDMNGAISSLLRLHGYDLTKLYDHSKIDLALPADKSTMNVRGCVCPIKGFVHLTKDKKVYWKLVQPLEYRQIKDHLNSTVLPLHAHIPFNLDMSDGTWTEAEDQQSPVTAGLSIEFDTRY